MSPFLVFLIACLATFRISFMLSSEDGPLAAFAKMRRAVPPKTNPGKGIRCFFCWSVWCAALCTGWLWHFDQIQAWITPIYWLGISGGAIVINRIAK